MKTYSDWLVKWELEDLFFNMPLDTNKMLDAFQTKKMLDHFIDLTAAPLGVMRGQSLR